MIGLADIRDWLRGLGAVEATWSIGRLDAREERRCCVYQRADYGPAQVAIGGRPCTRTLVKRASVLVHWSRNHRETEEAALALEDALRCNPPAEIGGAGVSYVALMLPEPIDLGSDDNGIFERAIWLDIHYQEAEEEGQ